VTQSFTSTGTHDNRGPARRSQYSDSLRAGRSGYRIPVGARIFAPLEIGPGAYPSSSTIGQKCYFPMLRDCDDVCISSIFTGATVLLRKWDKYSRVIRGKTSGKCSTELVSGE